MQIAIVINRGSKAPLHRQIYDQWRTGVLSGRFRPGERVPSSRELARALDVARASVTTAYEQLVAEGYFDTTTGSGTFVCRQLPDDSVHATRVRSNSGGREASVRLSNYATRLRPVVEQVQTSPGVIDLSSRTPDFDHFPVESWRRLVTRHLRQRSRGAFGYARHPAGHPRLRAEIAVYLARSRAVRCTADQVIVVNGSQQALDLCGRLLVNPGDRVAFEDPGYLGARQVFAAHGASLRGVPVKSDGISVPDVPPSSRVVFVTPSHQFPTGVSMSLTRRLELIEWARRRRAVIIEDDYDSEYRYSGAPLPALQSLAHQVPVVYVGTFSNVMFPGLRVGYLVVPATLVDTFTRAKWISDHHTPVLEQLALADFLHEGHLDRHVRRMRRMYGRRRDALVDALGRHFGSAVTIAGDAAGMHVLARFRTPALEVDARAHGVHLRSATAYYLSSAPAGEFILGFSAIGERAIREGIRRLAVAASRSAS